MERNVDLDHALAFVGERIEEEATRSGEPLTDEQRFLLKNLPRYSALPVTNVTTPDYPPVILPRDVAYERLVALAKDARHNDMRVNPASDLEWKCAVAVSKLHRHPMSWLLRWAGMKERRPWWDRPLLVGASLLFTFLLMVLMLFGQVETGTQLRWVGIGVGYVGMLLLLYFAARHIEEWQLKQTIEKYRRDSASRGERVNC
jgi:hypothetical protein